MSAMAKSKPSQEQDATPSRPTAGRAGGPGNADSSEPQPRIEVTKSSPKKDEKAGKAASAAAPSAEEEDASQATVIMQAPSAFEQLVEKILKKHKI
jgi:hypothetical protein